MILAAYDGRCAITGCDVEDVLDAAHIIPYVDARSNLLENGLCLRTDLHRLYDRNLIRIGADLIVRVGVNVRCEQYRALDGKPVRDHLARASVALLAVRHKYV